ncbi:MAG: hypothetical protein WB951_01530 [Candidatus Sulfotelmatobacter sp.]
MKVTGWSAFIAGLLYLLRFERVDNLGAYSSPSETGLLIPLIATVIYRLAKRIRREVAVGGEGCAGGWCPAVRYDSLGLSKSHSILPSHT